MDVTHQFRLGGLLIHSRRGSEPPYDGEVWAWSGPELNRIAYVDEKGDLWIARADGKRAERVLRGPVTLPAWSEDGRLIAVTERRDGGARWDISIVRVPERFRQ
jgi:Tol biopolymer transport system component